MLLTGAPPITRADYEGMPEGPPYFQVIEGDLVMSPSPRTVHQIIAGRIYSLMLRFLEKHPLGEVFITPLDVFLNDVNVYQPDVIFVSSRRKSIITEQGIEGAPDLVVEILSPGTARFDKGSKRKVYARTGVKELWMVDPGAKTIQVYLLAGASESPAATYGDKATSDRTHPSHSALPCAFTRPRHPLAGRIQAGAAGFRNPPTPGQKHGHPRLQAATPRPRALARPVPRTRRPSSRSLPNPPTA
jgi:Uma2 family endonuclease